MRKPTTLNEALAHGVETLDKWSRELYGPPVDEILAGNEGSGQSDDLAVHSLDFRSVRWYGTKHAFTASQANCVRLLWEAWSNETPDVGNDTIAESAEVSRIADLFRAHLAWGTMIVQGDTKGTLRLSPPKI